MKAAAYKGSDYLKTQKDVVAYLNAALEDGEPAVLLEALRNVAMAKGGMAALARAAGVSRESLYRTLSRRGNPKIETIMELLRALGLKLTVERRQAARSAARSSGVARDGTSPKSAKRKILANSSEVAGAPGGIRTPDPQVRRLRSIPSSPSLLELPLRATTETRSGRSLDTFIVNRAGRFSRKLCTPS